LLHGIGEGSADGEGFARHGLAALPRLVASELTTLSICDLGTGHRSVVSDAPGAISKQGIEAFDRQFVERLSQAGRTNVEPVWFYVPALLVALLPVVVLLPGLALVVPGRSSEREPARARAAFLWGWALVPCILFSASSGKETRYLLPTLPAWMLLLAWCWNWLLNVRDARLISGDSRLHIRVPRPPEFVPDDKEGAPIPVPHQ